MCGIFGFSYLPKGGFSHRETREIIQDLSRLSDSRGKEASGIVVRNGKEIAVYKAAVRGEHLIRHKQYQHLLYEASTFSPASLSVLGHSRMSTQGSYAVNSNNQPVAAGHIVGVHNGICVNDEVLWKKIKTIRKKTEVDTEAVFAYLDELLESGKSVEESLRILFSKMEGSASIAAYHAKLEGMILATNTGSLFYASVPGEFFLFASEAYIVQQILSRFLFKNKNPIIHQLKPGQASIVRFSSLVCTPFQLQSKKSGALFLDRGKPLFIRDLSSYKKKAQHQKKTTTLSLLQKHTINERAISKIRRCTHCILPETMPLISFDQDGVCNYCHAHTPIHYQGRAALEKLVRPYRNSDGQADCIVALSGGRDSSYGLHYLKTVMKLNPIAYTYDWGMITDIGRRNQARLVGKLGVEHVIVSADLQKKRENIRKNIAAWLRKPDLGMVPLFMAGDKQAEFYAEDLRKKTGIDLVFYCRGNELENEEFKWGYCGIHDGSPNGVLHDMSLWGKAQLAAYYGKEFLLNPGYINSSLVDTAFAYFVAYIMPLKFTYLWHYIPWDEKKIITTLEKHYNWEREPENTVTWRIDDGSVAFYNYIFYRIQGFTENDTFRSNQIREGLLNRAEALRLVQNENTPRYKALQWYFDRLSLDGDEVLSKIDRIPTLY